MAFREKFMKKAPKILALRTLEQTSCKTIENPETLINTGFKLGNTWQHPKSPQNEALNIAEAPKTAASAVLKASLGEDNPPQGEDKYAGMNS